MKKILILAGTFIITFLLVLSGLRPVQYDIAAGRTAPTDIYASREITDKLTTEARRNEAEADLTDRYDISEDMTRHARTSLTTFFEAVSRARSLPEEEQNNMVDNTDISLCLSMDSASYESFCRTITDTQNALLENGILNREDALHEAEATLKNTLGTAKAALARTILSETLTENKVFNPEKTEEARQNLRESVPPVTYKANQIIVRRGDIVSEAQYEVLLELGMIKEKASQIHFSSILGIFLLLSALFASLYLYAKRFIPALLEKNGLLLMAATIFILTLFMSSAGISDTVNPYLLPIVTGTALLSILLDIRFSILYNGVTALLCVLIFKGDVYCLASLILSGTLSAFIFRTEGVRRTLVISALIQSTATAALYFGIGVLEGLETGAAFLRSAYGLAAGGMTSVFVIGTLPFWEFAFDVTTPYKLLDLANPEQKLLKRLLTEAPGTYHHSLMVGNLAEAACDAIGGDALLARCGAYYHDVGKLRRPQYFKENQYVENPHDKMSPTRSASVICSHVPDGVELARQHRLPGAIRNIILSHHGNSLVAFFYHKATIENEGALDEAKFRYDAPLPQTKEEAVVMLSDSVEAAVRSLSDKTEEAIREMVHKIIQGKLADGQLRESGLTLRDIERTENAFIHVFCSYFHSRIAYPEQEKKESGKEEL